MTTGAHTFTGAHGMMPVMSCACRRMCCSN
ncbi:hypothetical protein M2121_000423 [Aurantimicrobium minutum]|nr:hypothetical protein [Aurantimicrobium minutum]MDH6254915.1 hypothetical protein [Aurantimicrobium minutum]MDH6409747.1 hypothetical protein [Aurantimicrobium minutum]MDH6535910.1 hypothetical protein [Aurantimicrobium minutum]